MLHTFVSPLYLESPHTLRTPLISTPYAFGFPIQKTLLAYRIAKSHLRYRCCYFLESPNVYIFTEKSTEY